MSYTPEISPVGTIYQAMQSAEGGQMPPFTPNTLLDMLHLDGETPDGKSLADRLLGNSHDFGDVRAFVGVMRGAEQLIEVTNSGHENPAQLAVAQAIGGVVVKQISREDDICPGARSMALSSTREDIIPQKIRDKLTDNEAPYEVMDENEVGIQEALEQLRALSFLLLADEVMRNGSTRSRSDGFGDLEGWKVVTPDLLEPQQPVKQRRSLRDFLRENC